MRQEAPGEMDLYTYILNARGATDSYNTKIPLYGRLANNGETFIRYTRPFRQNRYIHKQYDKKKGISS